MDYAVFQNGPRQAITADKTGANLPGKRQAWEQVALIPRAWIAHRPHIMKALEDTGIHVKRRSLRLEVSAPPADESAG